MKAQLLLATLLIVSVAADMYLHVPAGSNDRNRERSDNRNNGNLLFDSQNNAQGGYPWRGVATTRGKDDAITYYVGSLLTLEWTNQHACGPNPNTHCDVIIQYATDDETNSASTVMPGLRDGYPIGNEVDSDPNNSGYRKLSFSTETCTGGDCQQQNQDGTQTIPADGFPGDPVARMGFYYQGTSGGVQFAMHEGIDYYNECQITTRNKGLYTADQNVNPNGATGTRQNPNGGRRGLECPEERDYYPYWRYSPWIDMAIMTSNTAVCEYYQENSQNVQPLYFCDCGQAARDGNPAITRCQLNKVAGSRIPINSTDCTKVNGTWKIDPRTVKNLNKPDCISHSFGRDNHLGNTIAVDPVTQQLKIDASGQPIAANYQVKIPSNMAGKKVAFRLRYNISTFDYPPINHALDNKTFFDSTRNCKDGGITNNNDNVDDNNLVGANTQCFNDPAINLDNRPLYNRPYITVFSGQPKLSIALNTHQSGRTFQDRSYVFRVADRPAGTDPAATIWNLNTRGRRGNIVQCYPSVEYDFVPQTLRVQQTDLLHIQFHGSDFNAAKNANNGEGWQYSDRFNILQTDAAGINFPSPISRMNLFTEPKRTFFALLNQDPAQCGTYKAGDNNEQNAIDNCGKLNRAPARFPPNPQDGLVVVQNTPGTYYYVSTRNNNFSNRSQKAQLIVDPAPPSSSSAAVTPATATAAVFGTLLGVAVVVGGVLFYGKKVPSSMAGKAYQKVSGCRGGEAHSTSSTSGFQKSTTPDMEYSRQPSRK